MDSPEDNKPTQTIIAKEGSTVKNVIQAIIHLPAWAWVVGVVIISVALLLVSAVFNVEPLQALLPTPTAFALATEDQSLIIVADFEDRSKGKYEGIDPAQYVYEQLVAQVQKDNLDVRIERLRQNVDDNNAKQTGKTYNATMVVWGWYDALTITPRIARTKTLEGGISNQEDERLSISDPDKVEFSIVTDLPSQTTYLVMFTLGMDKFSNGNFKDALVYFNNAITGTHIEAQTSTNPSEAYAFRAYIYQVQEDDHNRAIVDYSKAIELNPEYVTAYNNRGIAYKAKGDFDSAIADYTKAIELDPEYAFAYNNRGNAYYAKEDFDSAIADYNKAIELDPKYAFAYNNRGRVYDAKEDFDSAIADYTKAIELNPKYAVAYRNRGIAYYAKGDFDSAIADYTKAIELDPEYVFAYNNRGLAYYAKGGLDSAIADYNKAIELDPEYADAYYNRGLAYKAKGDLDSAIADYTKAIELDPEAADVYNNRGNAYYKKGDYDRAIADFNKAIEFDPIDAYSHNDRCWIYYLLGEHEKALPDCEKAVALAPDIDYILDSRASVYAALGRKDDAIKDFERILEISSDPELRKRAEEELLKLKGE